MKTLKCVLALFAFVGLMLVGCSDESQSPVSPVEKGSLEKSIIHNFTITDVPILPPLYPWPVDPGIIKFLPNGKIQFKKVGVLEVITSKNLNGEEDLLASGIMEHYLSTMIDGVTGEGAVHGSFTTTPTDNTVGGVWVGTYEGFRSYNGKTLVDFPEGLFPDDVYDNWTLQLKVQGHGKGGIIDGWQMCTQNTLTIINFGNDPTNYPFPMPQFWFGQGTGFYKEH